MEDTIRVQLKVPMESLEGDLASIRVYNSAFPHNFIEGGIDGNGAHFENNVLMLRNQSWVNPPDPIELNQESLDNLMETVIESINRVWKLDVSKFMPRIRILDYLDYKNRINEIEEEVGKKSGVPSVPTRSLPSSAYYPSHHELLYPPRFIIRSPIAPRALRMNAISQDTESADYHTVEKPWGRDHLEWSLFADMSRAVYRHLRGETKEMYYKFLGIASLSHFNMIKYFGNSLGNLASINESVKYRHGWIPNVLAEKIIDIKSDSTAEAIYLLTASLRRKRNFKQLAMMDGFNILDNDEELILQINTAHPNYEEKCRIYNGGSI